MQGKKGVLHPNSKPVRMMKNGVCLKIYQSIHLAKQDGFNDTLIIRCCKGRMKNIRVIIGNTYNRRNKGL